jgi:hypothetical protein
VSAPRTRRLRTVLMSSCAAVLVIAGCGSDPAPTGTSIEETEAADTCPPADAGGNAMIDWVPFVVVDDVHFQSTYPEVTVDEPALGEVVSTVRCKIADHVGNPEYVIRDGDAAFLPVGTELREVIGYRTDFRLAAHEDGKWRVYESYHRDDIRTGEDMLDLRDKVTAIHLVEGYYGRDIEKTIDDPAEVTKIVNAVLDAPAIPEAERDQASSEEPVFVRFDLVDGTSVQRAWHVDSEVFALDFRAPAELTDALAP